MQNSHQQGSPPPYTQSPTSLSELRIISDAPPSADILGEHGGMLARIVFHTSEIKKLTESLRQTMESNPSSERSIKSLDIPELKELSQIGKSFVELVWGSQESSARANVFIDDFSANILELARSSKASLEAKISGLKYSNQNMGKEKKVMDETFLKSHLLLGQVKKLRKTIRTIYENNLFPSEAYRDYDSQRILADRMNGTRFTQLQFAIRTLTALAVETVAVTSGNPWISVILSSLAAYTIFMPLNTSLFRLGRNATDSEAEPEDPSSSHGYVIPIESYKYEQCMVLIDNKKKAIEAYLTTLQLFIGVLNLLQEESNRVIELLERESGAGDDVDVSSSPLWRNIEVLQSLLPCISSALEAYSCVRVV